MCGDHRSVKFTRNEYEFRKDWGILSSWVKPIPKSIYLTLGRTRKFTPPPWYMGGGGLTEPFPKVFDMLQYFQMILPSVEILWSSQQGEVYFMGGGAAGGL